MNLGTILTAIVTPFDEQSNVNEESFVALMRHLAENGSDGFVVAGTTGEASTLTDEEQLGLIELAVAERPEGATIVAGTGTNDTRQAVDLTERATALGVDATLSVTPTTTSPSRLGLIAPLRSRRRRDRQTGPALQHPRTHRHQHAPTCSRSSPRSTGSRASSRPTPTSCSRSTG
jgi:dihydrodipicolinate synthase/N-acetylneuraminate lyase